MLEELWSKGFAVECKSQEEYDKLRCLLHELGFSWNSGTLLNDLDYLSYVKDYCCLIHHGEERGFQRISNAYTCDYVSKIFDFDDFVGAYAQESDIGSNFDIKMLFDKE